MYCFRLICNTGVKCLCEIENEFFQCCLSSHGEFVRDGTIFYRGEVQTNIYKQKPDNWKVVFEVVILVFGWGYDNNDFKV